MFKFIGFCSVPFKEVVYRLSSIILTFILLCKLCNKDFFISHTWVCGYLASISPFPLIKYLRYLYSLRI